MNLAEVLLALQTGKAARRQSWHNGIHYIYIESNMGIPEPFVCRTGSGGTMNWPLFLGRGDWCADDWIIANPAEFPKPSTGQALVQQTTTSPAQTPDPEKPAAPRAPRTRKAKPAHGDKSAASTKPPRASRARAK